MISGEQAKMKPSWSRALDRLSIQGEVDGELWRRARLFTSICLVYLFATVLGFAFLFAVPPELFLGTLLFLCLSFVGYLIALWLIRSAWVDLAAILVVGSLSGGAVLFTGVMGGDHEVAWLPCFSMLVVSVGLSSSRIWIAWLFNMVLYVGMALAYPDVYLKVDGTGALLGPYMMLMLTSVAAAGYAMVRSHEESFAEATRAAREALEAQILAQASSRAKSQFLANMSHELRTPLNAITGYAELIREELGELDEEDACKGYDALQNDLDCIEHSSRHLLSLIDDVLDLAKIESGKMVFEFTRFDLKALCDEVLHLLEPAAQRRHNTLSSELREPLWIVSDAMRVRQILFNLLSNAVKFTENGQILLSLTEQDGILLRVRDTGIGMSQEQIARVFDAFVQADESTTRRYGGTGLGLTLCRNMARLLGGELDVESALGAGSCFTLSLPHETRLATLPPPNEHHASALA